MTPLQFKAVIFDLDGVITQTAAVHSAAWKQMFDDFLKSWSVIRGEAFRKFTHQNDYLPFVDGKPRYKGVQDFLKSRGIDIDFGNPSDKAEIVSCCGLGNRKNFFFNKILKEDGVGIFDSTVDFIKELKKHNIRIGVASSSKNCKPILDSAGLLHYFETRVDGVVSAEAGLKGKPEPDIFISAADNLGVSYDETVIVEDAVSGVQAGKAGNFGLVLGIARENNLRELKINGADIVVSDLSEISLDKINDWFIDGKEADSWQLQYLDYVPEKEKSRETLLAVGNGYFGTRGALEECSASGNHYPGTYMAGLYNRLVSKVGDRDIENEDLVNCPNWLPFTFKIEDQEYFDTDKWEIIQIERKLDFRTGILSKSQVVQNELGQQVLIESSRVASMHNPHIAAISYAIKPLNFSGQLTLRSGLDADLINDGVARYRDLNQQHLENTDQGAKKNYCYVYAKTVQSRMGIAEYARIDIKKGVRCSTQRDSANGKAFIESTFEAKAGHEICIEKVVALVSSGKNNIEDSWNIARQLLFKAPDFESVSTSSQKEWKKIWEEIDIQIKGDRESQKLLRLHLYHLMVSASPHNKDIDASFTARGLHGEAYRGHIFWDELFIMPFYDYHFPEVSKAALMYRYRRLEKARDYAKQFGYAGAMFPWQSGSDGREETQVVHLNPITGKWGADHSCLQRHVSLAIAFNTWHYYLATGDDEFMAEYGKEMIMDIARFWASKCEFNQESGKYSILKVMGPDEFHEMYPGAKEGGITDNAYTNLMVAWLFNTVYSLVGETPETSRWKDISTKLNIVINEEGIIAQYDGYFNLKELDWDAYRKKYGNIYRLDRILKAEGKSPDEFKLAKQADTLMTFYNLESDEVKEILDSMGYKLPGNYLQKNLDYYLARTSHGSSLSRVVHAHLALMAGNKDLRWKLYSQALESDFTDVQGGTTGEGIHFGVMAGTLMIALKSYAGVTFRDGKLFVKPGLPKAWDQISFSVWNRGNRYFLNIQKEKLDIKIKSESKGQSNVNVMGRDVEIPSGQWTTIRLT